MTSPLSVVAAETPATHTWSVHPDRNFKTLGLESFGNTVKDILEKDCEIADGKISERLRWHLQEKIWDKLEPKQELKETQKKEISIAIWLKGDSYLFLNPTFEISPLSKEEQTEKGPTIGKIGYLGTSGDPKIVTYALGKEPREDSIIKIGPQERKKDSPSFLKFLKESKKK